MDIELIEDASVFQHWIDMLDIIRTYEKDIENYDTKVGCLYFQMADGGVINVKSARHNRQLILSTLVDSDTPDPSDLQWTPVAFCKNMEEPIVCDDTGETINVSPEVKA